RTTSPGGENAFVTKFNAAGSGLVYSTYLGGASNPDGGAGIALDVLGNAYVTGFTEAVDFPTTAGALATTLDGGQDAFVVKLNATGTGLLYSTYLGGSTSDIGYGIAVDAAGIAYVTGGGGSTGFPTVPGGFNTTPAGGSDAFVARFDLSNVL